MGGMMSQNILNLVDIGMVGHLGDTALAATGIGSFTNYLAISFIIGLSAGVQALAARRLGEDRLSETAVPLNGGLMLALIIGVPFIDVIGVREKFVEFVGFYIHFENGRGLVPFVVNLHQNLVRLLRQH